MNSKNIPYIVIAVLIFIICLGRCNTSTIITEPKVITIIDTITIRDTIKSKPKLIKIESTPQEQWDTVYIADTSYRGLKTQYLNMADDYLSNKYYGDTVYIKDSITGWLYIKDTVRKNTLTGRGLEYFLNYPKVTTIITLPAPKVRQLYFGGELHGNLISPVALAAVGLIYKDRKDQMFGLSVGYSDQIIYGVSSYWKIKLK
jgi:hypothetical protein